MKGYDEDLLIKWVHVLIKTEEAQHRTVGARMFSCSVQTEFGFIHAQIQLGNNLVYFLDIFTDIQTYRCKLNLFRNSACVWCIILLSVYPCN